MLDKIYKICEEYNVTPLYVTKFGSFLYGTNLPTSDTDYKVIYLPNKESMLVNSWPYSFSRNTGNEHSKNTKDDIDIEFNSIHKFIHELGKGDTGALDVAYSVTNSKAVIYMAPAMEEFFNNVEKFYDITNLKSYLGYAQAQAMKYSVKGERLSILNNCVRWLDEHHDEYKDSKIKDFYKEFLSSCESGTLCSLKDDKYIHVLGSDYMITNSYTYFYNCLKDKENKYGERAKKVSELFKQGGVSADWKALSHAYRCIVQVKELLRDKRIKFPLNDASTIVDIKLGLKNFEEVVQMISSGIKEIEMINKNGNLKSTMDTNFIHKFILHLYNI